MLSHTRRGFERAKEFEPEAVAEALALNGAMYRHEKQIRDDTLTGTANVSIEGTVVLGAPQPRLPSAVSRTIALSCLNGCKRSAGRLAKNPDR